MAVSLTDFWLLAVVDFESVLLFEELASEQPEPANTAAEFAVPVHTPAVVDFGAAALNHGCLLYCLFVDIALGTSSVVVLSLWPFPRKIAPVCIILSILYYSVCQKIGMLK